MLITQEEIAADKTLAPRIKAWAGSMNLTAKGPDCPTFKLTGPCELPVRMRMTGARKVGGVVSHAFMGGEEFRIASVNLERDMTRDGVEVRVTMNPANLTLAAEVASLSLPLQQAIGVFDDLEDWVDTSGVEKSAGQVKREAEKARIVAETAHLPSVEEVRSGDEWGAW